MFTLIDTALSAGLPQLRELPGAAPAEADANLAMGSFFSVLALFDAPGQPAAPVPAPVPAEVPRGLPAALAASTPRPAPGGTLLPQTGTPLPPLPDSADEAPELSLPSLLKVGVLVEAEAAGARAPALASAADAAPAPAPVEALVRLVETGAMRSEPGGPGAAVPFDVALAAAPPGVRPPVEGGAPLPQMTPLRLDTPSGPSALGERINWMLEQGRQEAEMQLDPPHLGKLEVRVAVQGDQARLAFAVDSPQARELVEAALPRLREMLASSGFAGVDVQVASGRREEPGRGEPQPEDGSGAEQSAPVAGQPAAPAGGAASLVLGTIDLYA